MEWQNLLRYGFITLAPDETIPNTAPIYRDILTLKKEAAIVNYTCFYNIGTKGQCYKNVAVNYHGILR